MLHEAGFAARETWCQGIFFLSSLQSICMDGQWETVKAKQRSNRPAIPAPDRQNGTASGNGVFAAIDANWKPGVFAFYCCTGSDGLLTHKLHHQGHDLRKMRRPTCKRL